MIIAAWIVGCVMAYATLAAVVAAWVESFRREEWKPNHKTEWDHENHDTLVVASGILWPLATPVTVSYMVFRRLTRPRLPRATVVKS